MRRTWKTAVSPTIGMVVIGTAKIGFGPACAAAGVTSEMAATATAPVATARRSRREVVRISCSIDRPRADTREATHSLNGLVRQRIRPQLHLEHLGIGVLAALAVEVRPRARGGPEAAALPAGGGIVDPAVDILGEEAERIRHTEGHELAIDQSQQRFATIGGSDRHVGAEAEDIVAVDPEIIGVVGTALGIHSLKLRARHPIDLPAFRTLLAFSRGR